LNRMHPGNFRRLLNLDRCSVSRVLTLEAADYIMWTLW
jgi:hypothetical protein